MKKTTYHNVDDLLGLTTPDALKRIIGDNVKMNSNVIDVLEKHIDNTLATCLNLRMDLEKQRRDTNKFIDECNEQFRKLKKDFLIAVILICSSMIVGSIYTIFTIFQR